MQMQMQPIRAELAERLQEASLRTLDLDKLPGPLLPTLNGLLLGYPVVHAVTAATVDAAAACLSSQPLRLVQLSAASMGATVRPAQSCGRCSW